MNYEKINKNNKNSQSIFSNPDFQIFFYLFFAKILLERFNSPPPRHFYFDNTLDTLHLTFYFFVFFYYLDIYNTLTV